jgi:AcrR family transcriptional regulator
MPKGFSEQEKKLIKKDLIKKATELFGTYGLRKTNLEEITSSVGIAKGSFYSFYNSKEELFLDVLQQSEKALINEMRTILKTFKTNPKEKFRDFINFHIKIPKEHPIIQQVTNKKIRNHLIRKLQGNEKLNHITNTYEYITEFIKGWQDQGYIIKENPEIIAGVLKSIFTIGLDKETIVYIGKEKYEETISKLVDIIINYFIFE